ncbi:MAG: hypothetical protein ACI9ND_001109 [Yoonia sp.]|jgi:hypothetical protein
MLSTIKEKAQRNNNSVRHDGSPARPVTPVPESQQKKHAEQICAQAKRHEEQSAQKGILAARIFGDKGSSKMKTLNEEELREFLWERYGGMKLVWDQVACGMVASDLSLKMAGIALPFKQAVAPAEEEAPWEDMFQMLTDFGVDMLPIGRTVAAGVKLVGEVVKMTSNLNERVKLRDRQSDVAPRSSMEKLGLEGLLLKLQRDLRKNYVRVGTYTASTAVSFFDFTGLSKYGEKGAELGMEFFDLYYMAKSVRAANLALGDKELFKSQVFLDCPILACTLINDMHVVDLLNGIVDLNTSSMSNTDMDRMVRDLDPADQLIIKKAAPAYHEVKWLAQKWVQTSLVCLPKEKTRRRISGATDYVTSRAPNLLNIHKTDAPVAPSRIVAKNEKTYEQLLAEYKNRMGIRDKWTAERTPDRRPKPPRKLKPLDRDAGANTAPKAIKTDGRKGRKTQPKGDRT